MAARQAGILLDEEDSKQPTQTARERRGPSSSSMMRHSRRRNESEKSLSTRYTLPRSTRYERAHIRLTKEMSLGKQVLKADSIASISLKYGITVSPQSIRGKSTTCGT